MELKIGHSVIAWNKDSSDYTTGKFIKKVQHTYIVLVEDACKFGRNVVPFENCKLDPKSTEFLNGDKVKVSDNNKYWQDATYIGYSGTSELKHCVERPIDLEVEWFEYCRYPRSGYDKKKEKLQTHIQETQTQLKKLKKELEDYNGQ